MGYSRKVISLISIAIADGVINITEVIIVGTVISIGSNQSSRQVVDIAGNFISKIVGKQLEDKYPPTVSSLKGNFVTVRLENRQKPTNRGIELLCTS